MDFSFLIYILLGFSLLRANAYCERRLQARRTLHALISPLYTYLGLLDHELQNENYHADRLVTQAVLDHVTELRAFLLQPESKDLVFVRQWPWIQRLNRTLCSLEEALEGALQEDWDEYYATIKEQVAVLNGFIKNTKPLNRYASQSIGVGG